MVDNKPENPAEENPQEGDSIVPAPIATEEDFVKQARLATAGELDVRKYFPHLELRWACLIIYIIEPFVESQYPPQVIPVTNGWNIYDYGNFLAISRAEKWIEGLSTTGPLITSAQEAVVRVKTLGALYSDSGAEVALWGLRQAQFAFWTEAAKWSNVKVVNFLPDFSDFAKRDLIEHLQHYGTETWQREAPTP